MTHALTMWKERLPLFIKEDGSVPFGTRYLVDLGGREGEWTFADWAYRFQHEPADVLAPKLPCILAVDGDGCDETVRISSARDLAFFGEVMTAMWDAAQDAARDHERGRVYHLRKRLEEARSRAEHLRDAVSDLEDILDED